MSIRSVWSVLIFAACGGSTLSLDEVVELDDLGVSEQSARVSQQQAQLAAQVVDSTRAYLPFAFTEDGCYGRALYMSMELAVRRVPSSAQYLIGDLSPGNGVFWGWHVAPMVEIEGGTTKTVLDPALAPSGPVTLDEWVRRSNPRGRYELFWTLGSTYYLTGMYRPTDQGSPVIQSFAQLAPFRRGDVEHACAVMDEYLSYEGRPDEAQKRALLLGRTRSLANRLLTVGKLTGYQTGGPLSCGPVVVPLCKEASETCTRSSECCSTLCSPSGTCQARAIDAPTTPPLGVTDAGVAPRPTSTSTPDAGVAAPTTPILVSGQSVSLSGAANSQRVYRFDVSPGTRSLRVELRGTSGDADLYVRFGAAPSRSMYDARPYRPDSNEVVTQTAPRAGAWYVMVDAYSAYANTTLTLTAQ